jgi:predicted nucleotidyltransferase
MTNLEEISIKIKPIAKKYNIKRIYVFGSYARGTQNESSDIDFCVDTDGSDINTLFDFGPVFTDLKNVFYDIYFDLITLGSLHTPGNKKLYPEFIEEFNKEGVLVYGEQ